MPARPYQIDAENAVAEAYDQGWRQQIISMATGTGKTWVFSSLYDKLKSRLPGQMLVLAHTEELIDQNIATMRQVNPSLKVDKEMAQHKADPSTADVVVASVATLGRKGTSRLEKYDWEKLDKIIVDEAHHSPATTYKNVLEASGVLQNGTAKLLLGVTATPQRSDGKALADIYKKIVYVYSMRQAIKDGWLVDVRGYKVNTVTNLANVGTTAGDFNKDELADAVNNPERNNRIVKAWQELGQDRRTVVFTAGIQHAKDLSTKFNEAGIKAEAIWGEDPDRKQKLADHREGKIKVLLNCGVLTEGYDDPGIGCIIIARPTKSAVLFTQMCGRGTRLQTDCENLKLIKDNPKNYSDGFFVPCIKTDCLIIDVVDMSGQHSLCTLPTLMGLPNAMNLQGQSLLGSVEAIEHAQEEFPNIDFTKLSDMDKLQSYIEQVNLFEVRFPEEVEANSEMKWYKAVDGGYRINVPRPKDSTKFKNGNVTIHQNLLDKWEVDGYIKDRGFHGVRSTMEEAFAAADQAIRERAPEVLTLLNRKAGWHDKPVSVDQFNLLKRLYPYKVWPDGMTKGQASHWIDQKLARKAKR